jgi:hypothetical protein
LCIGNPVGRWLLDGDALGVFGDNGTVYGDPVWESGHAGQAITLDGDLDHVRMPDSTLFKPTQAISFGAWIKTSGDDDDFVVEKQKNSYVSWALRIDGSGAAAKVQCLIGCGTSCTRTVTSTATVGDGAWHHVMCTYDRQNLMVYVDQGGPVATAATDAIYYDGTTGPRIGFHYETTTYFHGSIDDVRIYDLPLSETEVSALAQ